MATIPLTQGKVAIVDDEDYPSLSQFRWYAHRRNGIYYAARNLPRKGSNPKQIQMHVAIMGARGVDHRDGDGLNNQKANLRWADAQQQAWNRKRPVNNRSGVTGVGWQASEQRWRARITVDGQSIFLGNFIDREEAIRVRQEAEDQYFGEWKRQS